MRFLLDSNTVIALVMKLDRGVISQAKECEEGDLVTSAVAFAEVAYGSRNAKPPPVEQLSAFAEEVPVLPFDRAAAIAYAALPFRRASYDRLIAAHALSLNLILVTRNERHFGDLPQLKVENWFGM